MVPPIILPVAIPPVGAPIIVAIAAVVIAIARLVWLGIAVAPLVPPIRLPLSTPLVPSAEFFAGVALLRRRCAASATHARARAISVGGHARRARGGG